MHPHNRSQGRSWCSLRQHTAPRDSQEATGTDGRVVPSAPPWPGPPEPRGEQCHGVRLCGAASPTPACCTPDPTAPASQLLDPSLCCSGKRPQSGWRSKSEHCPHTVIGTLWEQRRATVTAQHTDLTLMDRQMDTALAVYLGLARCRAAGGRGGACSGALLIGLRAVQPVLRDGARVGGLHQIHALGAQVDAVILVWGGTEGAVRPHCQPRAVPKHPQPQGATLPQTHPLRRSRRSVGSHTAILTASRFRCRWIRNRCSASSTNPNSECGGSCTSCGGDGNSSCGAAGMTRRSCRPWQRPAGWAPHASPC